jgi:hypothetical protein
MIKQLDDLQIYFGEPFIINDKFQIQQATMGDIIRVGESAYYGMVHLLTAIPSDYISYLHDNGINYMEISDFEFFAMLIRSLKPEHTSILFGELDFSKFALAKRKQDDGLVLYNEEQDVIIDELAYKFMFDYLCKMHLIKKQRRRAGNKSTYDLQVEDDRLDKATASKTKPESQLLPLISSMVNSPGFKYNIMEIRHLTLFQFMDAVQRIGLMTSTERLAVGYYTGNLDQKKFDTKNLDWMKDLQK